MVAERVVELLEAVEVDHRHRERASAAVSRRRSWNRRRLASPVSSSVSASVREWCSAVFSMKVSAIRTRTSTSVAAARKTAASIVWWKWSSTSRVPATRPAPTG